MDDFNNIGAFCNNNIEEYSPMIFVNKKISKYYTFQLEVRKLNLWKALLQFIFNA